MKNFDANLYAAFLEGNCTKSENRKVLKRVIRDVRLAIELDLAAVINKKFRGY